MPWARLIRRVGFHEFGVDATVPHLLNLREVLISDCVTDPGALADLLLYPSSRGVEEGLRQVDSGDLPAALRRFLESSRGRPLRWLRLTAAASPTSCWRRPPRATS